MPKKVQLTRELLAQKGLAVTAANIKDALPAKDFNLLGQAFRATLCPQAKEKYGQLKTDESRREWLAQFIIDPDFATLSGWNSCVLFNDSAEIEEASWITEEQLGGPDHLNSAKHARLVITAGELQERDHEVSSLAAAGVKQYRWTQKMERRMQGKREEMGTTAHAELTAGEYINIHGDMQKQAVGSPNVQKRKAAPKPKPEETEHQKRLKACASEKQQVFRRVKVLLDKCVSDAVVCTQEVKQLESKGYPNTVLAYWTSQISTFEEKTKLNQASYARVITDNSFKQGLDDTIKAKEDMELIQNVVDNDYLEYKQGVHADVKKLAS